MTKRTEKEYLARLDKRGEKDTYEEKGLDVKGREIGSTGTFEETMEKVWELFVEGQASYISTHRFLKNMEAFTDEDVTRLILKLLKDRKELTGI